MNIWELIIQQPLTNVLIVLSDFLAGSFGLAIVALTILVNLALLPMTLSQIRSTKAMQAIQPKMAEIQKKFGRDRQKLAQEQMRLYKESGIKPAGCALSLFVQMPVWLALYQSIMLALAAAPEGLLNLSKYLYPWPVVFSALPLGQSFLGINLAETNIILAVLVAATMWIQQKMTTTPSPDPRQAQQAQMMLWMMPMMFGLLAMSFPAGLSLYWVTSSLVRIGIQYKSTGLGGLKKQPKAIVEDTRKGVKFEVGPDNKTEEKTKADIVIKDMLPPLQLPQTSKNRYQPGKDRSQHKKK